MKEEITKEKDKRKKKKVHRKNKDVFTSLALKYKSLKHLWVWEIILWLPFASSIIFHPCTLNLCLSLEIRWIFWRQSIFGPYYFFNPISHCVSFAELNSFALRVIIDKWGVSTAIFCFVVALYLYCFFFPLGFCLLSLDFCDLKKNPSFFHISCPCSRLFFHSYCEMCINVC